MNNVSENMPDHLYRFRSIHALLDGHNELEKQEIYFCPADQLNDPLEGFKDIFWQGDHIVWRNLLRHYLLNLLYAIYMSGVMGKEFSPAMCVQFVLFGEDDLPMAPIKSIYATACKAFFDHPMPSRLVAYLSSSDRSIRRDELTFFLRLVHPFAYKTLISALGEKGLNLIQSAESLDEVVEAMNCKLQEVIEGHKMATGASDVVFWAIENIQSQLALLHEIENFIPEEKRLWQFVFRDFPSFYVNSLERLLYPDWHVACFVSDPTNASMWGSYADSHRGICLKFNTKRIGKEIGKGFRALDLYRANSWSSTKDGKIVAHYAYVPHKFEEVSYTSEFPEIDFFGSIGVLPIPKLNKIWFAGENGERSTAAERMFRGEETWRQEYWRKFTAMFSTKSTDWKHEKEHRLILHSNLQTFEDTDSRKLKYRFSDLSGIVFGIKTTAEDKLKVIQAIKHKCIAEDRKEFEFYQAYYSGEKRKIELAPLSLLKKII